MRAHPYRTYGLLMVLAVAGLVALSLAAFNRVFQPAMYVSVQISRAGLQLLPGSDVKVRGLIIGDVDSITSDGRVATLRLRLDPAKARTIPDTVSVRLLPKTLFGEKYVDLVLPASGRGAPLHNGEVIGEDRSQPALEIDQALDDLLPLLRTVRPAQLNETLTALATALEGRGQELGQTLVQLDDYLHGFNGNLPALQHDLGALPGVASTYDRAAGPLLQMLGNLTVTSRTIVTEQAQLTAFLDDVAGVAVTTSDLLQRNGNNIVAVNAVSRDVVALLARYSPEFPCFFQGWAKLIPRIHKAVPDKPGLNHAPDVIIKFVPSFPTYHYPQDLPEFGDTRGPSCYDLPNPPVSLPRLQFKDGTENDPRFKASNLPGNGGGGGGSAAGAALVTPPSGSVPAAAADRVVVPVTPGAAGAGSVVLPTALTASSPSMGLAGTAEEQALLDSILGPVLQMPSTSVPDIADLLWGPLARGSTLGLT